MKCRVQIRTKRLLLLVAAGVLLRAIPAWPQTKSEPPATSGDDIIAFLSQAVAWYRHVGSQSQLVNEPGDILFFNDSRQMADEVVRLSFDFARTRAAALPAEGTIHAVAPTTQYQRMAEHAAKIEGQVKQTQQELDGMRQQLEKTTGKKRRLLQATIAETESELALYKAQLATVHNLLEAASGNERGGALAGNLNSQIEQLARTVPAAAESTKGAKTPGGETSAQPTSSPAPAVERQAGSTGLLSLVSHLLATRGKMNALNEQSRAADSLAQAAKDVRAPLVAQARALTQKGDQLAGQPDSTDPATLAAQKQELDALTAEYKQLSTTLLPLGKESILLDLYKRNISNWRDAVQNQFRSDLKSLVLRLAVLGLIVGLVFGIAEVWRRATFRYVTDARRRYQFLLVRRIVLWSVIAIIIAFAFSNELGALTTFAGLLTAGVALALQSVLLSMVGYFLLIGKYGMRVGDRVQIAGVVGDVVEIGLVRVQLMEVTGGTSPQPTGRVVGFPNSVVFQTNTGMFKPLPGTNFLWHEITVTLGPESNYRNVEERMLGAVNKVYAEYRERMEQQRRRLELSLRSVRIGSLAPESRLRLTPAGLEIAIRYPVELNNASEIDDHVTRELLEAVGDEPKLRVLGAQIEPRSA
jgi:small-conductance mechanosensitive channel